MLVEQNATPSSTMHERKARTYRNARATACGKVIVSGEHAVVYGKHAVAIPLPLAVEAHVSPVPGGERRVKIATWGLTDYTPIDAAPTPVRSCLELICARMHLTEAGFHLSLEAQIPRGSGLGGSAAMAVATVRALAQAFHINPSDDEINALAFECETIAHGTPSGVDNTVATYGKAFLFRKEPRLLAPLTIGRPVTLVIGITGIPGMTLDMVRAVRELRQEQPHRIDPILNELDAVTLAIKHALELGNFSDLGVLMNVNHGLLCALGVSSPELDALVHLSRRHGALGAKLTGGGGGGAIIALCPTNGPQVMQAMQNQGYKAQIITAG